MKKILLTSLLLLSGCATIISGSNQKVAIKSTENSVVTITNTHNTIVYKGKTPTSVRLPAGDGYFTGSTYYVTMTDSNDEKIGYSVIDSSINKWYFGNIILGGLIGMVIVDPLTGAMWELPKEITINRVK